MPSAQSPRSSLMRPALSDRPPKISTYFSSGYHVGNRCPSLMSLSGNNGHANEDVHACPNVTCKQRKYSNYGDTRREKEIY